MKPYGQNAEPHNTRDYPDKCDIGLLGMSTKNGKQKSRSKRARRRIYKKSVRRVAISSIREYVQCS